MTETGMSRIGAKIRTLNQARRGIVLMVLALLLGRFPEKAIGEPTWRSRLTAPVQAPSPPSSQKPSAPTETGPARDREKKASDSSARDPLTDPERELLDRAAIEYRKAEHRRALEASEQILARARELSQQWGKHRRSRRSEELLREIERFARRVRSISGASDLEAREPLPEDPMQALARLRESAERLHKTLKALTAYVISIEVMERSDEIIRLARYLRERARADHGT